MKLQSRCPGGLAQAGIKAWEYGMTHESGNLNITTVDRGQKKKQLDKISLQGFKPREMRGLSINE